MMQRRVLVGRVHNVFEDHAQQDFVVRVFHASRQVISKETILSDRKPPNYRKRTGNSFFYFKCIFLPPWLDDLFVDTHQR
jgi:hypothetical protein